MAGNEKTDTRKPGEHLKKNEVKTEIIKYILSKNGVVSGPDTKKYLREKPDINIVDEKNIRVHLKNLQNQHCIEKIPCKPGLENRWKIEKRENLRNIREHYPDIQLNTCDKSLDIIFEDQSSKGYFFGNYFIHMRDLRVQLYLSNSFFNACLDKDIKTLCDEAYEYYKYGEGFEECKHIQNCIDIFYKECIKSISVSPNIWLDVDNTNTSNFSELESYQSTIKSLPNAKISKEKFREILEEDNIWRIDFYDLDPKFVQEYSIKLTDMVYQKMQNKIPAEFKKEWEKELKEKSKSIFEMLKVFLILNPTTSPVLTERSKKNCILRPLLENEEYGRLSFKLLAELFAKTTYEIFQKMFKEIPAEFLDTPDMFKIMIEIFKKISQEVKEILVIPDEMCKLLIEITIHRRKIRESIGQTMFKHYFDRDIEDGTISSDERDYMVMMKDLQADFKVGIISKKDVNSALDTFYKNNLEKHKEKLGNP